MQKRSQAWEHWASVAPMAQPPAGYLFFVGKSRVRPRKVAALFVRQDDDTHWFEPALGRLLVSTPERQRVAVVLVHAYGWSSREVAQVAGIKANDSPDPSRTGACPTSELN